MVSIVVKTHDMGRENLQAANVDLVVFDEEPPEPVYTEVIMRLRGTKTKEPGIAIIAATPCKGLSPLMKKFIPNGRFPKNGTVPGESDRYSIQVTWEDAPHLSEDDKRSMLAEIPVHQRDARTKGLPTLGQGQIYPVAEEFFVVQPFVIPEYWPRAYGLDFATYAGKTACVWIAQDPHTETYYVYDEYKRKQVHDEVHVLTIKNKGSWMRGACDPSGGGRRDNGALRINYYREMGLDISPGDNSLLTGLGHILNLFESGKLKFFNTCQMILEEQRVYMFDEKDPNKPAPNQDDHLLDALRYGISKFKYLCKAYEDVINKKEPKKHKHRRQGKDGLTGY